MTKIDAAITEMAETMKAMHELVAHVQAAFAANQVGLMAIAEQLAQSGHLDAAAVARRMHNQSFGHFVSPEAARAISVLADDIAALASNTAPQPPRGGKPKLVR